MDGKDCGSFIFQTIQQLQSPPPPPPKAQTLRVPWCRWTVLAEAGNGMKQRRCCLCTGIQLRFGILMTL